MIGEVITKTAVEVGKKAAEVAAEAAKEVSRDAGKVATEKPIDITKRVDVSKAAAEISRGGIDITKRIQPESTKEIIGTDVKKAAKEYLNDLKMKSDCADTLSKIKLDVSKLEIQSPERVKELRKKFVANKSDLRKEWEKLHNKEWPKYKKDVFNEAGIQIRKAGDYFDAHHIKPLQLGGTNEASNLTPLDLSKHSEVHSLNGSCNKLVEAVKGVK